MILKNLRGQTEKKKHWTNFYALETDQRTGRKTRRRKVRFWIDFGSIVAPILAPFWYQKMIKKRAGKIVEKYTILEAFWASFWTPEGDKMVPKWCQNSGHGPRGVQSGHFGQCWTSFWSILGLRGVQSGHFGPFRTSFWSILGLILDKFRTNLSFNNKNPKC